MSAHDRRRVRRIVEAPDGVVLALELPTGTVLHPGQVLHHDAETAYVVAAAHEDVIVVRPRDLAEAARVGHLIGNLHRDIEADGGDIVALADAALADRLARAGVPFERAAAVSRPRAWGARPLMADLPLLQLLQLFDSQFPVGAFAHSGGLETYGQAGARLPDAARTAGIASRPRMGTQRARGCGLAWSAAARRRCRGRTRTSWRIVSAQKVMPSVRDTSIRLGRRTLSLLGRLYPGRCSRRRRRRTTPSSSARPGGGWAPTPRPPAGLRAEPAGRTIAAPSGACR